MFSVEGGVERSAESDIEGAISTPMTSRENGWSARRHQRPSVFGTANVPAKTTRIMTTRWLFGDYPLIN
jgi:hypothetical protein